MLDAKTEYWFPMRVTYGRQTIVKDFLDTIAIRTFLPTVAAAGYLLFILSAIGRTGINPIPTAAECNTLAINGLSKLLQHSATVGEGLMPSLVAVGYLLFPDFVTFLLRTNTFLDNHTLIAFTSAGINQ